MRVIAKGDHVPGRLDACREFADDHRPDLVRQDVLDFEPDGFSQGAEAADEVGNGRAARRPSDPWQCARIPWNFENDIFAEQGSDDAGFLSFAQMGEKLTRDADVLFL